MTISSYNGIVGSAIATGASGGPPWNLSITTTVLSGSVLVLELDVTNGNAPSAPTDSQGNSYTLVVNDGIAGHAYVAIGDIKNTLVGGTDYISISPSWSGYMVRALAFTASGPLALRSGQG